jgi:hypothetical protein
LPLSSFGFGGADPAEAFRDTGSSSRFMGQFAFRRLFQGCREIQAFPLKGRPAPVFPEHSRQEPLLSRQSCRTLFTAFPSIFDAFLPISA